MKQQGIHNKIKGLLVLLLLSVLSLVGITIYAFNWEYFNQIDWKGKWQQAVEKAESIKERVFPEEEPVVFSYDIAEMTSTLPVLTRSAEGIELIEVPLMNQKDYGYLTGCELVSGAMVLNYYESDKEITPQDVYEVIDKVSGPVDSRCVGVSPHQYFIGNPKVQSGYGCYAEPLVAAMDELLGDDWHAVNVSGMDLATIESAYLAQGTPVVVWATIHMMEPQEGNRWRLEDGTEFQWIAGEHCLVLIGADDEYYYFNDPDHVGEVIGYERTVVEQRYEQLGRQAVIVSR